MFRLFVIVAVCSVALSSSLVTRELDDQWESFKQTYNKKYTEKEYIVRRLIWEENLRYIQKHNLEADRGLYTFTLGENEYTDMTNAEFNAVMNGYKMVNGTGSEVYERIAVDVSDLPDSVDWRTNGYVTEVKNQGQCGSCWAFSTTGSLEGQTFKKTQKLVSLSESNLVDCSSKQGNSGCEGGLMTQAFTYIKDNNGIDTEESYPYKPKKRKCEFSQTNVGATDTGYHNVWKYSEKELQKAVATVGPISVAIDASHGSFQNYKKGIYTEKFCSSHKLDHGVLVVGYGSDGGNDYWIVKNSWGKSWGMDGYILMARGQRNMCGIATQASYPKV